MAGRFAYPPTPDLSPRIGSILNDEKRDGGGSRRIWVMAAVILALGLLLAATPAVRASVREFLQLGAVRLTLGGSDGAEPANGEPDDGLESLPAAGEVVWPPDFAGETTLAEVRRNFSYPVLLPAPSAGFGEPDLVFAPEDPAESVILIWLSADGQQPRIALFELAPSAIYRKQSMVIIERTEVAGQQAIWASGPYLVEVQGGELAERRLIDGHVLIWAEGPLTYRLETGGTLRQAVTIAEGLE